MEIWESWISKKKPLGDRSPVQAWLCIVQCICSLQMEHHQAERERGESVTVTQRLWTPCRSAWHQCKEGEYTCSNTSPCLLVQFIPAMSRGDRAEALLVQKVHTQSVWCPLTVAAAFFLIYFFFTVSVFVQIHFQNTSFPALINCVHFIFGLYFPNGV